MIIIYFTSLHFTSLHFTSLHFISLHFTSLHMNLTLAKKVPSSRLSYTSGEAKHSNRSCYANLQLSGTIKTIANLHSMTCIWLRHCSYTILAAKNLQLRNNHMLKVVYCVLQNFFKFWNLSVL